VEIPARPCGHSYCKNLADDRYNFECLACSNSYKGKQVYTVKPKPEEEKQTEEVVPWPWYNVSTVAGGPPVINLIEEQSLKISLLDEEQPGMNSVDEEATSTELPTREPSVINLLEDDEVPSTDQETLTKNSFLDEGSSAATVEAPPTIQFGEARETFTSMPNQLEADLDLLLN
jgi:hypothetical protein